MSKRTRQSRENDAGNQHDSDAVEPKRRPSLQTEALEPRILLSATWVDADGVDTDDASNGNDTFTGSEQAEVAEGLNGDDTLFGNGGDDSLWGNNGSDALHGGAGNDLLDGGNAGDVLDGGPGDDTLLGGNGADVLDGGDGDDFLDGGKGDDVLDGGSGNNEIHGGKGADTITSGGGDDVVSAGEGDDMVHYHGGHDHIDLGKGEDTVVVHAANDGDVLTVDGSNGTDTIDLSAFTDDQVSDDGSTISVDLGGGESFTINHTNVANIITGGPGEEVETEEPADAEAEIPSNEAPIADAGVDQTADAGATVTLNASASTDADGDNLAYTWSQTGGPEVTLSDPTAPEPSFVAPDIDAPTMLAFEVEVSDGDETHTDTVEVAINPVEQVDADEPAGAEAVGPSNEAPIADAGVDQLTPEQLQDLPPELNIDVPNSVPAAEEAAQDESLQTPAAQSAPESSHPPQPLNEETDRTSSSDDVRLSKPDALESQAGAGNDTSVSQRKDDPSRAPATGGDAEGTGEDGELPPAPIESSPEQGTGHVEWDGSENLEVLDPMHDVVGSIEFDRDDDAVLRALAHMQDAVDAVDDAAVQFMAEFEVEAPSTPETSDDRVEGIAAAPGHTVADLFEEISTPADSSDAVTFGPVPATHVAPDPVATPEGEALEPSERASSSGRRAPVLADAYASDPAEQQTQDGGPLDPEAETAWTAAPVGFFARLWGAIRGVGATGRRTDHTDDRATR